MMWLVTVAMVAVAMVTLSTRERSKITTNVVPRTDGVDARNIFAD